MALDKIGELYKVEAQIREAKLEAEDKRQYRGEHATPLRLPCTSRISTYYQTLPGVDC